MTLMQKFVYIWVFCLLLRQPRLLHFNLLVSEFVQSPFLLRGPLHMKFYVDNYLSTRLFCFGPVKSG